MRNVAVVIQFGLCDSVDTLAQRFGRAGRDPSSPALCLLLAPPKLFIEVREKKERAAAKRKKKTIESPAAAQNGDKQMVPTTAPEALHSDDEGDEPGEEYVPVAMAVLNDKNQPRGGKRKRAIARDLNPELDAFINAASLSVEDERFNCRRRVLQIHYGTDSIREYNVTYQIESPFSDLHDLLSHHHHQQCRGRAAPSATCATPRTAAATSAPHLLLPHSSRTSQLPLLHQETRPAPKQKTIA